MTTITRQVVASSDDCFHYQDSAPDSSLTLDPPQQAAGRDYEPTSKLQMIYGGGLRFLNVTIPKGATITSAYLKLTASYDGAVNTVNSRIRGQDADNPDTFTDLLEYIDRVKTTAIVYWNAMPAWTKDVVYTSPAITSIIQEIINRGGWASGNALVLFWDDNASSSAKVNCCRLGYSYDGSAVDAPTLEISYEIAVAGVIPRRKLLGVGR